MCLIVTDKKLLARVEAYQSRFIARAGFSEREFLQFGVSLEQPTQNDLTLMKQALEGRSDPEALALREMLEDYERYAREQMPSEDRYFAAFEEASNAHPRPQSRLQRLDDHYMLCELMGHINDVAHYVPSEYRWRLREVLNGTTLVTAPIGRCNAFVVSSPKRGQCAIILDDEVGRLSVQLGFLLARIVGLAGRRIIWDLDAALDTIQREPEIRRSYANMIRCFLTDGSSRMTLPVRVDENGQDVMILFAKLNLIWSIGHELGHVALRHLETQAEPLGMMEEVEIDVIGTQIDQELSADRYADMLTCVICDHWSLDNAPAYAAGSIVLSVYRSIYKALCARFAPDLNNDGQNSVIRCFAHHPSPSERLEVRARYYAKTEQTGVLNFLNRVFEKLDSELCSSPELSHIKVHPRWEPFVRLLN